MVAFVGGYRFLRCTLERQRHSALDWRLNYTSVIIIYCGIRPRNWIKMMTIRIQCKHVFFLFIGFPIATSQFVQVFSVSAVLCDVNAFESILTILHWHWQIQHMLLLVYMYILYRHVLYRGWVWDYAHACLLSSCLCCCCFVFFSYFCNRRIVYCS